MKKGATVQGEEEPMKKPTGAKDIGKKLIEKTKSELNEEPAELYRFVPRDIQETTRGGYIMQQVVGFICGAQRRSVRHTKRSSLQFRRNSISEKRDGQRSISRNGGGAVRSAQRQVMSHHCASLQAESIDAVQSDCTPRVDRHAHARR